MKAWDSLKAAGIGSFLLVCCLSASAYSDQEVSWAGFSFISQADQADSLYPFSTALEKPVLRPLLTKLVLYSEGSNKNITGQLMDAGSGSAKSLVVALDKERITSGKFGGYCRREYSLSAQVILYDGDSQSILSITPVGMRRSYIDHEESCSALKGDQVRDRFRFCQMYLGLETDQDFSASSFENKCLNISPNELGPGLLKEVAEAIATLEVIEKKNIRYTGIGQVNLRPEAVAILKGDRELGAHGFHNVNGEFDVDSYANWIGQSFSKSITNITGTPVVPLLKGKAIGGSIPLKFSDQVEVANLKLPQLDYSFDITVRGFKKVVLDETSAREAWAFGTYFSISFGLLDLHKPESLIKVKNAYVYEKARGDHVNDWQQFDYSSETVFRDFAENIGSVNQKWVKKNSNLERKNAKNWFRYIDGKLKDSR